MGNAPGIRKVIRMAELVPPEEVPAGFFICGNVTVRGPNSYANTEKWGSRNYPASPKALSD